jgi:opacity protein-like surface antigen
MASATQQVIFRYPDGDDRFGGKNGKWVAGYTVSAGGEVKLTDNWSLRGEIAYLHFDVNHPAGADSSTAFAQAQAPSTNTSSDATAHDRPMQTSTSARSAWSEVPESAAAAQP